MHKFKLFITSKLFLWIAVIAAVVAISLIFDHSPGSVQNYVIRETAASSAVQTSNAAQAAPAPKASAKATLTAEAAATYTPAVAAAAVPADSAFVYSANSKKLHLPDCASAKRISPENLRYANAQEAAELLENGFEYCKKCHKD